MTAKLPSIHITHCKILLFIYSNTHLSLFKAEVNKDCRLVHFDNTEMLSTISTNGRRAGCSFKLFLQLGNGKTRNIILLLWNYYILTQAIVRTKTNFKNLSPRCKSVSLTPTQADKADWSTYSLRFWSHVCLFLCLLHCRIDSLPVQTNTSSSLNQCICQSNQQRCRCDRGRGGTNQVQYEWEQLVVIQYVDQNEMLQWTKMTKVSYTGPKTIV